ncbi:MAG: DUF3160 domain-containing protein [Bacteroidia bacterium]
MKEFTSLYEPIKFIIGEPDNLSILDITKAPGAGSSNMFSADNLQKVKNYLSSLDKNKITPKGDNMKSCKNKINLMPQRFVIDNEVIQDLTDTETKPESKRPYPKGIDVFGALGVKEAENLLLNYYDEDAKWDKFTPEFNRLRAQMGEFDGWDHSVYNKWIQCLGTMQQPKPKAPYFMKNTGWARKELNTALASWAELKHDAILYAEQPMGAECGDGGPPPPITVGYVEPNVPFWKSMLELIDLTEKVLKQNGLFLNNIANKSERIREMAEFLLQVSEKEINGQQLTESEYNTIEIIGSTVEYMTISLLDQWVSNWNLVKGPDREVSVVADIYTANAENNPDKGVLHVGVGPVNDIYVVVEIEGYLYLTRGAVFSYYEFLEPMGSRLTDEEWQARIKQGKIPEVPEWVKDIIFQYKSPEPNEKIFYSSGC